MALPALVPSLLLTRLRTPAPLSPLPPLKGKWLRPRHRLLKGKKTRLGPAPSRLHPIICPGTPATGPAPVSPANTHPLPPPPRHPIILTLPSELPTHCPARHPIIITTPPAGNIP